MLFIETKGSWRDMGRQIGESFSEQLHACIDRYASWLVADLDRYRSAISQIRDLLAAHAPELIDESEGLAESSGVDSDILLGYRFFNEVRDRVAEGCSVVYIADSNVGPILGRNCDLSANFDPDIQLCRACRPTDGQPKVSSTYLGMAGGVGLNASGLATGSASAHTRERYSDEGLPGQVLGFLMLGHCADLSDVRALMSQHSFLGKSQNCIAGDRSGVSMLFEMAPGKLAEQVERPTGQDWQVCTNFFLSGRIPIDPQPLYLESAYARYGRMSHCLGAGLVDRSVSGIKQLLTDIAQPGLCIPDDHVTLKTAYSQVMELATGKMHITPGHPLEARWQVITL